MANKKTGFAFYNIDTDRYQDIKIKRLKKDFSCSGIAVYDYILSEIYRVKGCFLLWDEHTAFDVSDYFGIKENLVNEIVNYCCSMGLFNKELFASDKVLSSKSIQDRYLEMCTRAKRKEFKIPEEYLILTEECKIVPEESAKTQSVCHRVEKSRVEKSKVEDGREGISPTEFLKLFNQIRISKNLKSNIKKLSYDEMRNFSLIQDYSIEEFKLSIINCLNDEWVIEKNQGFPNHFLKSENFTRYLNSEPKKVETAEEEMKRLISGGTA